MEITRIYNNSDGESFFELIPLIMEKHVEKGYTCHGIPNAKKVHFRTTMANQQSEFIRPPASTYVVIIEGSFEIEVSWGKKQCFGKGDVLLFDDITGKGHRVKTNDHTIMALLIEVES